MDIYEIAGKRQKVIKGDIGGKDKMEDGRERYSNNRVQTMV